MARPLKSTEFRIEHETSQAEKGWRDLEATQKNALADAWDRLTKNPVQSDHKCHQLKGELAMILRHGVSHERWQYELNGGARIWFYGENRIVKIIEVHTRHPNQTK